MLMLVACAPEPSAPSASSAEEPSAPPDEEVVASDVEAAVEEDVLPFDQIRLIVPFAPGGGQERAARQIQPYLAAHLQKTVAVEPIPGGNTAVGSAVAARDGADCSTVLQTPIPHLQFAWLLQDVDFTSDDFAPLGHLYREGSAIVVRNDAPWDNLQEMIDDARERPGEISFSTSAMTSPFYLALLEIERAAGVDFNIVNYDGGGPARTALLGGEVDGTHVGVFAVQPIVDEARVLAVHQDENLWTDITQDAPTVEEALGMEVAEAVIVHVGMFVSAACQQDYPERYEALVAAVEAAGTESAYQDDLVEIGEDDKFDYLPPEEFATIIDEQLTRLRQEIENTPELAELAAGE